MAQKRVFLESELRMVPECHPDQPFKVLYRPERGGDRIVIKCSQCYHVFFHVKLPKEREERP